MRKPLSIDGDMARRFLDLLDPDHDQFLFAAGDDNQARARASLKAGKPPLGRSRVWPSFGNRMTYTEFRAHWGSRTRVNITATRSPLRGTCPSGAGAFRKAPAAPARPRQGKAPAHRP
jgi:hypothetical protein